MPRPFAHRHALALALPSIVLMLCCLASAPALADPVPSATYSGLTDHGEKIELTVSSDGNRLSAYKISDVHGDTCTFLAQSDVNGWPQAPAIAGDAFEYRLYDAILLKGTFSGTKSASGSYRLHNDAVPGVKPACDTGTVAWSATTSSSNGSLSSKASTPKKKAAAKKRYATRVILRRRGAARLTGRVATAGKTCRPSRKVALKRGRKTITTVKSRRDGSFTFKRSAATRGRMVRATVGATTRSKISCGAGASIALRG